MNDPLDIEQPERERAEAADRARAEQRLEKDDLLWLMGSKRGRRIVHRFLSDGGVFRLSFNTNAMTMAFNEGMRNVALATTSKLLSYCPEQYMLMIQEQKDA